MARSRTKPGTRKLSDVARHVVVPEGIVTTGYPAVQAKCRDMGIGHDDWQQGFGRLALGKRKTGKYAATVGGVVISWMRQVGKTYTVGSILFALCIIFPRLTVLWTAHHSRTTDETFQSMKAMAKRRKVAPHIAYIRSANGQQAIGFVNGSRILFGAREHGFGRGFAGVDVIVFDEAQILPVKTLEDMVAATNQSKHPAGALLFYMGTPPRPADPGDAFRSKRAKALSGKSRDMVYVEISGDPDADPDDRKQWRHNPSFPQRTPPEAMLRLRENVGSDEAWLREGLGIWDELNTGEGVFEGRWPALADPGAERGTSPTFGVVVAHDRSWTAVSVAWTRPDGFTQVMLADYKPGTDWVADRVAALRTDWNPRAVVAGTTAKGMIPGAIEPTDREQALAHIRMDDEVAAGRVRHGNDPAANAAVRAARWRTHGDLRMLNLKTKTDISPIVAESLAVAWHLAMPPPEIPWRVR